MSQTPQQALHLLLIDDDKVDRLNTVRVLTHSGWPVTIQETATAEQGLQLAQDKRFDLILLDYQLPSMNGLEVLKRLKSSALSNTAVVMLSHSDEIELAIECIESGAQDFILKQEVTVSRLCRSIVHAQERFRIEQELRENHEKLRLLSEMDTLTGLANRYMFDTSLANALQLAKRQGKKVALLLMDLDKFKEVNDSLGHDTGDKLLIEMARRLKFTARQDDIVCRLGGDEFAIIAQNIDDESLAGKLARRILQALKKPYKIAGLQLENSASIGITTFPDNGSNPEQLFKYADIAMYRAKTAGRNQAHFYSDKFNQDAQRRNQLEQDIRYIIDRDELVIHYQPQIDSDTRKLICIEPIMNWQHPNLGLISLPELRSIAEYTGMSHIISLQVFENICEQLFSWRKQFNQPKLKLSVTINPKTLQINHQQSLQDFSLALARYQFPVFSNMR